MATARIDLSNHWGGAHSIAALTPGLLVSLYGLLFQAPENLARPGVALSLFLATTTIWALLLYGLWRTVPTLAALSVAKRAAVYGLAGIGVVCFFAIVICSIFIGARAGAMEIASFTQVTMRYLKENAVVLTACYVASVAVVTLLRKRDRGSAQQRQDCITIRANGAEMRLSEEDIYWVEALDNYVVFHTRAGARMMRASLAAIECQLSGFGFRRAHRSALVNLQYIREIRPRGSAYVADLVNGASIPVARRRRSALG